MTSIDILLHSQISFLFNCHQRCFLLQQMGTNRDPQPGSEKIRTHSSKWSVSIKSLPSELREAWRRGSRKSVRAWGYGRHQGNKLNMGKLIWTHKDRGNTHRACMGLHQLLGTCIIVSSLVFLWNSWVCEQVGVWFLCLFLGSFPSVGLS